MTRNRRSKQAVRARMAQSGLKYTQARRELIDAGGGGDGPGEHVIEADWPEDVLGCFSDQAYNLVLLADDEARMLGRRLVEPEHLLLAFARRGNAQRLLMVAGVFGRDIHRAINDLDGVGDEVVLGRLPRSRASSQVLIDAVLAAAERGIRDPSSEHVLLALNADARARRVLAHLGVGDLRALVDPRYPVTRGPIDGDEALAYARRASAVRRVPSPGPIPPIFERYSDEARAAIAAGEQAASELMHPYVEPFHIVLGCARTPESFAAASLFAEGITAEAAHGRARLCGPPPAHQATGIFADAARKIVAESALAISHRMGHPSINSGHLLLATLASHDHCVQEIIGNASGNQQIAAQLSRILAATND